MAHIARSRPYNASRRSFSGSGQTDWPLRRHCAAADHAIAARGFDLVEPRIRGREQEIVEPRIVRGIRDAHADGHAGCGNVGLARDLAPDALAERRLASGWLNIPIPNA